MKSTGKVCCNAHTPHLGYKAQILEIIFEIFSTNAKFRKDSYSKMSTKLLGDLLRQRGNKY